MHVVSVTVGFVRAHILLEALSICTGVREAYNVGPLSLSSSPCGEEVHNTWQAWCKAGIPQPWGTSDMWTLKDLPLLAKLAYLEIRDDMGYMVPQEPHLQSMTHLFRFAVCTIGTYSTSPLSFLTAKTSIFDIFASLEHLPMYNVVFNGYNYAQLAENTLYNVVITSGSVSWSR